MSLKMYTFEQILQKIRYTNGTLKDAQYCCPLGTWKLEIHKDITTHLLKHQKKNLKTDHVKCWQGCEATGMLTYYCCECKMTQPPWKII